MPPSLPYPFLPFLFAVPVFLLSIFVPLYLPPFPIPVLPFLLSYPLLPSFYLPVPLYLPPFPIPILPFPLLSIPLFPFSPSPEKTSVVDWAFKNQISIYRCPLHSSLYELLRHCVLPVLAFSLLVPLVPG